MDKYACGPKTVCVSFLHSVCSNVSYVGVYIRIRHMSVSSMTWSVMKCLCVQTYVHIPSLC